MSVSTPMTSPHCTSCDATPIRLAFSRRSFVRSLMNAALSQSLFGIMGRSLGSRQHGGGCARSHIGPSGGGTEQQVWRCEEPFPPLPPPLPPLEPTPAPCVLPEPLPPLPLPLPAEPIPCGLRPGPSTIPMNSLTPAFRKPSLRASSGSTAAAMMSITLAATA